jgi:KDO2-lipid IV(A) lauroyltransferase
MPKTPPASRLGRLGRQLRYRAEAGIVRGLAVMAESASSGVRHAVGTGLGTVVWAVDARHRRVAQDNVRLAYDETLSPPEARRIVIGSMRHFARLAVETLAFRRYLIEAVDARVRVEGLEHLREAYARGHGVLAVSGHLGNWELMSLMFGRLGMPASGIVRPLDNPYLEERLTRLRMLTGNRVINRRGAYRAALAVLQQGGILGTMIDQRPKRGGIPVPFFGTPAYTTDGLARLAINSDAAVVPCYAVDERDGSWRMIIEPAVPVVRTGDVAVDQYRITAECTAIIERWVRRYPDQWLWTHRRWAVPTEHQRASPQETSSHGA